MTEYVEECSTWEMQRLTILVLFGHQLVEDSHVCGSHGWDKQAAVREVSTCASPSIAGSALAKNKFMFR